MSEELKGCRGKDYQVDNPEWVEYLRHYNEGDTVYPRAFVHALLNDPESPLCRNRRSGEGVTIDCPIYSHGAVINCQYHDRYEALHSGVEQVRDEIEHREEQYRKGGNPIVASICIEFRAALTHLLDEDGGRDEEVEG